MATAGVKAPFMGSVSATVTAASVFTLLSAVWSDLPIRATYVKIQLDSTAGAASLYVGNSNVAANMNGFTLTAGQSSGLDSFATTNSFALKDVFLLASAGTLQVNLSVGVH